MTWTFARRALLATVLLAGVGVWHWRETIFLPVPGILDRRRNPIGPTVDVTWQAGPATPITPAERPPNIVVIVADDLGYNDLTFAGGGVANGAVPTPHIDSIARGGVEFTRGYAGNATCAPSRAAIMTGRYPTRFGFEFTPAPKAFMRLVARWSATQPRPPVVLRRTREPMVPPMEQEGLPPAEITIAELLRTRGYRTLGLGKWHLGEAAADATRRAGLRRVSRLPSGRGAVSAEGRPGRRRIRVQDFDPIDTFLWANLPFAVAQGRRPALRAGRRT